MFKKQDTSLTSQIVADLKKPVGGFEKKTQSNVPANNNASRSNAGSRHSNNPNRPTQGQRKHFQTQVVRPSGTSSVALGFAGTANKPAPKVAGAVVSGGSSRHSGNASRLHAPKKRNLPVRKASSNRKPMMQGNPAGDHLRITPLGGNEEVGRNMTLFEYGGDIIILDMGMMFPEEDMPGIDYIIPNISYLKGKEKNVRGVILSHGHLDHIGAAPILLRELGYPPIVGRDLTLALVKKKMEDFELNSTTNLKTIRVNAISDKVRLGKFEIEFFDVEHSVMDAVGVIIKTPDGTVIHPGDWTMDNNPTDHEKVTYEHLSKLPSPRILMLESLGATDTHISEKTENDMYVNLNELVSSAKGMVIIGTFSSQIKRIGKIIEYADSIGKKVALDGYSMKMNIEIAKELGYIKAFKKTQISVNEIHKHPRNKVVVVCTGAQGEGNAVLSRIVNDEHRFIRIQKEDTIIFSSSVIPGNERTIQRLKDDLYRKCDNVIHSDILDVHTSGHSNAHDIQDIIKQIQPDYFLPVYANHYFLKEAAKLGERVGVHKENIFVLDNGNQLEFEKGKAKMLPHKIDTSYVMVDGLGVGDVGEVVLRDRQLLAKDGMFMIVVVIDSKTKKIVGTPQITSRGFIFVKENFDLVNATKRVVEKVVKEKTSPDVSVNWDYVKNNIRESVGSFLFTKTERRPMVLPVVIEV
ncbi:MAG: ribonuclease J [Candidatus Moranbacteria bacterium]|nr:ribonuclease J [Candidatus Moranbacteria bacterium]